MDERPTNFAMKYADMSLSLKDFSYTLLSLITSSPASSVATPGAKDDILSNGSESPEVEHYPRSTVGLLTPDGAWCWREDCDGTAPSRAPSYISDIMRAQIV